MDYWELRDALKGVIGRRSAFFEAKAKVTSLIKEKGRKKNYQEFNLMEERWDKRERLLNPEEIQNFLEISLRAAACPMPLNADVYDALNCPFKCAYCFADSFRASLYTSFFDNSRLIGVRHCDPEFFIQKLDPLMNLRGEPHKARGDIEKAIAMEIPIRFGIRFEDFIPLEKKKGVSLKLLQYLKDQAYPTMINTKSHLVGEDAYVRALADNISKAAVHITMISSDPVLLRSLEPGAPSFRKRLEAGRRLVEAGVRVVARIEPYMVFINDDKTWVMNYMDQIWDAGIRHITFDNYSYSANAPGIRAAYTRIGLDFERMFLLTSDSQGLGSLLLSKFMEEFRKRGFSSSSFDLGGAKHNNQTICCEVGDWLEGGFNWGSIVPAARMIIERGDTPTRWSDFVTMVESKGGFLSESLQNEVKGLWNCDGNASFFVNWAEGVQPAGRDEDGMIWKFDANDSFREDILKGVLR